MDINVKHGGCMECVSPRQMRNDISVIVHLPQVNTLRLTSMHAICKRKKEAGFLNLGEFFGRLRLFAGASMESCSCHHLSFCCPFSSGMQRAHAGCAWINDTDHDFPHCARLRSFHLCCVNEIMTELQLIREQTRQSPQQYRREFLLSVSRIGLVDGE